MTATIAESFSAGGLDTGTVLERSRRTGPLGVLPVYLDVQPSAGLAIRRQRGSRIR
jgi:hypothetical protein